MMDKLLKSKSYQVANVHAEKIHRNPNNIKSLLFKAMVKAKRLEGGRLKKVYDKFLLATRMVKAYSTGQYKGIETKHVILLLAALIYFVMPLDFLPDFIFHLGLIDDVAILGWTINRLKEELDQFEAWEKSNT